MRYYLLALALGALSSLSAQNYSSPPGLNENLLREIQNLKYTLKNQETELRRLKDRQENQETAFDQLRTQVDDTQKKQLSQSKGSAQDTDLKIANLQDGLKSTLADLKTLQTHLNDLAKQEDHLESLLNAQTKTIQQLQNSLNALFDALDIKNPSKPTASGKVYRVENGDSLGKIAQQHHTTIKALRALNDLKDDKLVVGQKLKIPE